MYVCVMLEQRCVCVVRQVCVCVCDAGAGVCVCDAGAGVCVCVCDAGAGMWACACVCVRCWSRGACVCVCPGRHDEAGDQQASGISISPPGTEQGPLALKAGSPKH